MRDAAVFALLTLNGGCQPKADDAELNLSMLDRQ
jgi:hypothetical protein